MNGMTYIYARTVKNRVRAALRKPITYIYLVFGIGYFVVVLGALAGMVVKSSLAEPEGFAVVLIGWSLFTIPANLLTYAKRKGLLFRPSDTHFLFTAPVSPKAVLIYAQVKNMLLGILVGIMLTVAGFAVFHAPLISVLIYFIFSCILENIFETAVMLLLYGNERLSERSIKLICRIIWLMVIGALVFAFYIFYQNGISWETVKIFLAHPGLQSIPIIGWNIAVIRLLFIGPDTVNVVCTVLYLLTVAVLSFLALRMKSQGQYYEDAAKFADDYQEAKQKKAKGETARLGKKKKYGNATVQYKGSGAKAIFYRQLLEYKKNKTFIFSIMTLVCLAAGIGMAFFGVRENMRAYGIFVIPGVASYMVFCFSSIATKWSKEMENPYTYLLPDTPVRKLWYATLWEHIRSFIDGCLITFPPGIVMGLSFIQMILLVIVYVCLQANKLYINVLAEVLVGNVLGNTGKQLFRMLLQAIVISGGIGFCVLGFIMGGIELGFTLMIIYTVFLTVCVGLGASFAFVRIEN